MLASLHAITVSRGPKLYEKWLNLCPRTSSPPAPAIVTSALTLALSLSLFHESLRVYAWCKGWTNLAHLVLYPLLLLLLLLHGGWDLHRAWVPETLLLPRLTSPPFAIAASLEIISSARIILRRYLLLLAIGLTPVAVLYSRLPIEATTASELCSLSRELPVCTLYRPELASGDTFAESPNLSSTAFTTPVIFEETILDPSALLYLTVEWWLLFFYILFLLDWPADTVYKICPLYQRLFVFKLRVSL